MLTIKVIVIGIKWKSINKMLVEQVILSGDCILSIVQNSSARSPGGKTIHIVEICSVMNTEEQAMHFEHIEFVEMKSD